MKLISLEVCNFRNIDNLTLNPHERFTFIKGDNGHGKTNLMEALYLLFNLRPLRTGNDFRPLVQKGREFFSVGAKIEKEVTQRELFLSFSKGKKKMLLNKSKATPKEFLEFGPLHYFSPDQAALIVESPEIRRRVLDRAVFHLHEEYFDTLSMFKSVLKRRNTILKMERDKKLLLSLDHSFAPLAFEVSKKREQLVAKLSPWFEDVWSALKPDNPPLTMHFKPNLADANNPQELREHLNQRSDMDFSRGTSTLGPQREDIQFLVNGSSSKHFISHGERKIAALAVTLASIKLMLHESNKVPLLLIDDLAAELDEGTKTRVLSFLNSLEIQLILTGISFPWEVKGEGAYFEIVQGGLV